MKIVNLDKQCEDRCIIGSLNFADDERLVRDVIVYDGDTIVPDDNTIFCQFNFCPVCGQELECKVNPHSFKIEKI